MNKLVLLATTALVAFGASLPAFADSATITQTSENSGFASQHQPGTIPGFETGDTATIVQQSGSNDTATQETARFFDGSDFSEFTTQSITQVNNSFAQANQEDNSNFDTQTITQTNNVGTTTANQTVNNEFGESNTQTASQDSNNGSIITTSPTDTHKCRTSIIHNSFNISKVQVY